MAAASRCRLHQSLRSLNGSLGGHRHFLRGHAAEFLPRLCEDLNAAGVYWNRCYKPWRIDHDRRIKAELRSNERSVQRFNGSLLFGPHVSSKSDGSPYSESRWLEISHHLLYH